MTAAHCEQIGDLEEEEQELKKDEWLTELKCLHVQERRAMWAAEDILIACEGAVDELRDINDSMEETQGSLAAVQEFWIYGLEIASKAEEQRLLNIANERKAEAEQLEAEAERCKKVERQRGGLRKALQWHLHLQPAHRSCESSNQVVIKIVASLKGAKLSIFRLHDGRQDPRPYSQLSRRL